MQPGSLVTIYGANLADVTATWNGDYPTVLGGATVAINGKLGYLSYVSPTQINLEAPDDTQTGSVSLVVTNAYGSATTSVTLFPLSDTLIPLPGGLYVAGVILTPGGGGAYGNGTYDIMGPVGAFSFPTRPVKRGETLVLYGTGFGPTKPTLPAGVPYSGAGAPAVDSIGVSLNGVNASVLFAGAVSPGLFSVQRSRTQHRTGKLADFSDGYGTEFLGRLFGVSDRGRVA